MLLPISPFTVSRVNKTTFLIKEDDKYGERPFIYAKLHPKAPILILNDTGCDAPRPEYKHADISRLRIFLETYPAPANGDKPLNPDSERAYVIILSHCHYDHIGGIEQFWHDSRTEIVASAAGRDFIESDLPAHSLCKYTKITTPVYAVTHWAQSNERLTWPLRTSMPGDNACVSKECIDLGIIMLHTPGHTPDSLSWYDVEEDTIFVGDGIYRFGSGRQPIIFPPQGDFVEWLHTLNKLMLFVDSQDAVDQIEDGEWVAIGREMRLCASHETCNVPAKEFLEQAQIFGKKMIAQDRRPIRSMKRFGETFDYYLTNVEEEDCEDGMAMLLPRRLVDAANTWFGISQA